MTWNLTDCSFCQLRGITRENERRLHTEGIFDIPSLIKYLTFRGEEALLARILPSARIFLEARRLGMTDVIVNAFPIGTRVRVVADRFEKALFFDVETNGYGVSSKVTTIATCMNGQERVFVRGVDLQEFLQIWNDSEVIISFNGKRFDVPVLMREFGLSRIPAHIDLMHECRHYGLFGRLKDVEKCVGFVRRDTFSKNGLDAIDQWRAYCGGHLSSLEDLKKYNLDDTKSLIALFQYLLPLEIEELT